MAVSWPLLASGLLVIGAAAALIVSQFLDLRSVKIDTVGYIPLDGAVSAPVVATDKLGPTHSYLALAIGIVALIVIGAALLSRRWQLSRLLIVLGGAALAISVLKDLPAAKEIHRFELAYKDADWDLERGFWLQVGGAIGVLVGALPFSLALRNRARAAR